MSSFVKKIKSIPQWEKDLIFGHSRQSEKLIKLTPIPMAVSYLCLMYFYEYDYFHECEKEISINDTKNIAKVTGYRSRWVYGKVIIQTRIPMIYSWTLEGLDATRCLQHITISSKNLISLPGKHEINGLQSNGDTFSCNSSANETIPCDGKLSYSEGFSEGDTVKMEINTMERHIKYYINGKDYGVAFENVDFNAQKFRMALFIGAPCPYFKKDGYYRIKLVKFTKNIIMTYKE